MKEQRIIEEVAKLDGQLEIGSSQERKYNVFKEALGSRQCVMRTDDFTCADAYLPPYLTSRDVIVPVIEKQNYYTKEKMVESLWDKNKSFEDMMIDSMTRTSLQLCEALLLATNKWEDE